MIALLGAGLGIGVAVKGNRASAQETVESLVLPVPPAPTAIMDLPLPAACTDPALAEYKVGLLAYRDGIWDQAHRAFERAAEADPNCAEAHLRLVMTGHHRYSPSKTRQVFQRAVQIRAKLTERDQLLLNAFEPLVRSDPANEAEYYERLRALAERFPGDAELANLAATKERDRDVKIELAIKAIVTDTHYSDAWQTLGVAYADKGQTDEALSALAACLDAALNSVDCVRERYRAPQARVDAQLRRLRRPCSRGDLIVPASGHELSGRVGERAPELHGLGDRVFGHEQPCGSKAITLGARELDRKGAVSFGEPLEDMKLARVLGFRERGDCQRAASDRRGCGNFDDVSLAGDEDELCVGIERELGHWPFLSRGASARVGRVNAGVGFVNIVVETACAGQPDAPTLHS